MTVAKEPGVAATVMRDQMHLTEERIGREPMDRALARLDPARRREIEEALPGSYLSIVSARLYHEALAAELGRDADEWHEEIARAGTERTFTTVWRVFLRFTSLSQIVKRAAAMYRKTYDTGRMEADALDRDHATARVLDWPGMPRYEAMALAAGMEAVLHVSGRRHARATFELTPDGALFDVRARDT